MRQQVSCRTPLWVVLALVCWMIASCQADRPKYLTAYACEDNMMYIDCPEGHIISLVRANYGRFSITICNQNGVSDLNVNCMSNRSFRVLQDKCKEQNNCSIQASTQVFADPCPGTLKYLEAHYQCLPESTTVASTTPKLTPPWFLTTTPSDWLVPPTLPSSTKSSTTSTTHPPSPPPTTTGSPTVTTTATTSAKPHQKVPPSTTTESTTSTESTTVEVTKVPSTARPVTTPANLQTDYCPPVRVRDLQWNWTKKGEIATIPCPGGASGNAKWQCGKYPVRWTPDNPDLSGCKSAWMTRLSERIDQNDQSIVQVANDLAEMTRAKPLYGGDTIASTSLLEKMAVRMRGKLSSLQPNNEQDMIEDLMQSVIQASSNLLDPQHRVSWNDLSRREQMKAATSLLVGLEENAYLLADQVNNEKVLVKADRNVMMSVKVYEVQNVKEIHFPTNKDLNNVIWNQATDSIILPIDAVLDETGNDLIKVVFFTFSNLEELLQPDQDDAWLAETERYQNSTRILNTRIISASVGRGRRVPLRQPVTVTLRHLREDNISNPMCAFWNYDTNSWSGEGCRVLLANRTHTVCACDHLTNFAVLMDIQGVRISPAHELALQMITFLGCIISIVCLAFAFLTFMIFQGLKSDRNTIHKNLCACLLIAEVIFLAGINQTDKAIACSIIAGLLHFFFLCAFAWMFLEGFQLYVMLIEVFETEKSRVRWYYILAYGIPAIIVTVSVAIDPMSYGTQRFCWLRTDNYFIFSFVGPVVLIILANFVFLSIAIYMMCRHANMSTTLKSKEQSKIACIRSWIRGALVLVFLLGLTWTFGLWYLNEESIVMAYVFTVLNSLQGLFIFLFHCVQNEKVQKEYKKLLRRSRCLSACMKDSVKERRSSFYINSNGTASIPNSNSSGAIPQSNFRNIWGSQNGKSNIGRVSMNTQATTPGTQINGLPDIELEKSSHKSSNRDSGHGGSDHDDSSLNNHSNLRNNRSAIDYGGITGDISLMESSQIEKELLNELCHEKLNTKDLPHHSLKQQQVSQLHSKVTPIQLHYPQQNANHHSNRMHRPHLNAHPVRLSPFNHIYMDLDRREGEPVYEEIEHRHEQQVSDLSDEDTKRRSDVSRQSSGSYGDSRPLIPQNNTFSAARDRYHDERSGNVPHGHTSHQYQPRNARGRPPPPPEPTSLNELSNHIERVDPNCKSMSDIKVHGGNVPYNLPQYHPSIYYAAETPTRQPKSLPDLHGGTVTAIPKGGVPTDFHYTSDNALVAMLDGRKVVSRLQPAIKKDSHNSRTNSFSEC